LEDKEDDLFTVYNFGVVFVILGLIIFLLGARVAGVFLLSWVAWKSKRLGPSMKAHVIKNILSVVGGF
jgi:hypothetical protein